MQNKITSLFLTLVCCGILFTSCKAAGTTTTTKTTSKEATKATSTGEKGVYPAGELEFSYKPADDEEPEQVFLAGDFNGWAANDPNYQMEAKDGTFSATIELDPGTYKFKFVIDGQWVGSMEDLADRFKPEAKEFVDDGFGGKNAVIEVVE